MTADAVLRSEAQLALVPERKVANAPWAVPDDVPKL